MTGSGFVDQDRVCIDCEAVFTFTAEHQERHEARGWYPPRRCLRCRAARRAASRERAAYDDANRAHPPFRTW
jgi:hypothetical protein